MSARVIVITDRDNVATALDPLAPGETIDANGRQVIVRESIASGHKVALSAIATGSSIVKYGSPIGTASEDIEPGCHVHTHNVVSERGRGDKTRAAEGADE
ncbi:MAG TPA: UxaA family hydrolase [Vicinamibacterales bacterium]|nr:UxaA family hydrolase [Vicinamibacterales bacterium]